MTYQFERFTPECQKKLRLIELQGLASQLSETTDYKDAFQLAQFCYQFATNFINSGISKHVLDDACSACSALMVAAMFTEAVYDGLVCYD
jgi:hypothetical protein